MTLMLRATLKGQLSGTVPYVNEIISELGNQQ